MDAWAPQSALTKHLAPLTLYHTLQEMTLESKRKVTKSPQTCPDELELRKERNECHRPLLWRRLPARSANRVMDVPSSFEAKESHQSANQKMGLKPVYVLEYLVLSSWCCLKANGEIKHESAEKYLSRLQTRTVVPAV